MLRFLRAAPRRILIVRLGSIGDVARVLPMLSGLKRRFPDADIDWVVQAKAADLLRGHPQIGELFVVPFRRWREALSMEAWGLRQRLRARDYDLVLDFQGMLKGAVLALAAGGSAVRVGWGPGHAQNLTWLWHHGHRYPPDRRVNRHLRHRVLVDWLGAPDLPGEPPRLAAALAGAAGQLVSSLETAGAPRPWILAYPGSSSSGSHKRWDPSRFERALGELRRRTGGTVVVGWGPAEECAASELAAALDAPRVPPLGLVDLMAVIDACDLFIGMDTGPMHLAGLVGTPVVAVFGRSDPGIHGPARHLPGLAVALPGARDWPSRRRAGLPPFAGPEPDDVVRAALEMLGA